MQLEELIDQIKERARSLYLTRQLLCTEAVVAALNQALDGGLTDDQVICMAAPFSEALGGSGCLCGALSGAVMASGLFLGKDRPYRHRREMRKSARQLYNTFKAWHGATCCRVLSKTVRHDRKAHFQQCADFTADATEIAARLILEKRPDLLKSANSRSLAKQQPPSTGVLSRLIHFLFH